MTSDAFQEKPPQERIDEIEADRERRLDPENRPENAEVDNTDATLPTVEEFARANEGEDQEGRGRQRRPVRGVPREPTLRGGGRGDRGRAGTPPGPREPARERRGRQHRRQHAGRGQGLASLVEEARYGRLETCDPQTASRARRPAMQPAIIRSWFQCSSGRAAYDAAREQPAGDVHVLLEVHPGTARLRREPPPDHAVEIAGQAGLEDGRLAALGVEEQVERVRQHGPAQHPGVVVGDLGDRPHLRPPLRVALEVDQHRLHPLDRRGHRPRAAEGVRRAHERGGGWPVTSPSCPAAPRDWATGNLHFATDNSPGQVRISLVNQ